MFDLRKNLADSSAEILKKKFGISTEVQFDVGVDEGRGDLTTSVALQLAKNLGKKPQEVAKALADGLSSISGIEHIDVAGPGYVNVTLKAAQLAGALQDAWKNCTPVEARREPPVIVEYSQPNIAKPLGIHHILSTVIGQSISNIHRHRGFNTIAINHLGDWGTQFGKLAVAYAKWGSKPVSQCSLDDLLELYVKFHTETEKNPSLEDEGRAAFSKLEQGDSDLRKFWKQVVDITMAAMEKIYQRLSVSFDHVHGESFYEDKMASIIAEGKKKGIFVPGEEGALIATFPEGLHLPPAIVLKGDGSTIYLTRDLATIRYRIDTWHPQAILYVVDVAQQMYFKQLFHVVGQLSWELPKLEHILFGRMRFADKSMSTRKGNILRLEHVLDEAVERADKLIAEKESEVSGKERAELAEMMGVGSVVYGVLSQNRRMDMVFDWKKMLTFEGNSAPYLQYTHARAKSVMSKGNVASFSMPGQLPDAFTSKERALLKLLLLFQDTLDSSCTERAPHRLCTYLYELCQAYNSFYNADEILTAPDRERLFRLSLTAVTASVLKTGAHLLSLRVPERM